LRALVRRLEPNTTARNPVRACSRCGGARAIIQGSSRGIPSRCPISSSLLARLRVEGVVWNGGELLAGAQLLRSSRRTRDALRDERRPTLARAVLAPLADRLLAAKSQEDAIEKTLADDGTVRDDASPMLRRVRRELRTAEADLVRLLERAIERLDPHHRVSDMSVTVRDGRYVIPCGAKDAWCVGGIVHGASATGATLYHRAPAAVEFGNRIRELEAEEREEVDRILRESPDSLRPHRDARIGATDALATRFAFARSRFAPELRCMGT
jgi:DNA mismatch repair protein MutS2